VAGIYIHIPFCKQACTYCDFHFSTSPKLVSRVVDCIVSEFSLRKHESTAAVETVYFGGGTPGILGIKDLEKIIQALNRHFEISPNSEVTLETNPDDLTAEKAKAWKSMGVNRLSVGIQSFHDDHLRWMNRAHDAHQAEKCIETAKSAGFDNLTIDLIYGIPGMGGSQWKRNLEKAVSLEVGHISSYCLTVEPDTVLGRRVARGAEQPVNEESALDQYELMVDFLTHRGFRHYEVSNFALPQRESKHNTAYWRGIPYIGIGPAAHGFAGNERYWNVANNAAYCRTIESGILAETRESLSAEARFNEWIMTGLRTAAGIDLRRGKKEFGVDLLDLHGERIQNLISTSEATLDGSNLSLTSKGFFRADGIASDFFILEHEDQD